MTQTRNLTRNLNETRNLPALAPDGHQAVRMLELHVRSAVDAELLELVKLRASMVNGCAFCVDMHAVEAVQRGEDPRRLYAVAAWRESPFFSDGERAALALTDAVTRLGEDGVPDEVWDPVVAEFGAETAAELVVAIATINVWNRLAVTGRLQAPAL